MQVDERFVVAAPRAEVFRLWSAFDAFPRFMTGVESVFAETAVRLRWRVSVAGVEPSFYAVITEHVPDERIAWQSVDQSTMGWWVELADAGQGSTAVTVRVIWSPRGDDRAPAGAPELDELTIRCDLQRFRALAEARAAAAVPAEAA
ncbi:SRPBCC family protein [Agrococcus sp. 1P02AA]|uniref:SRPBCC family protein n=1 Tax=Agrococcus sp. 1P02AA TaxID=3132259 RepID=UPI0039A42C0E